MGELRELEQICKVGSDLSMQCM